MQTDASQVFEAEAAKEAMDLVAAANGSFSLALASGSGNVSGEQFQRDPGWQSIREAIENIDPSAKRGVSRKTTGTGTKDAELASLFGSGFRAIPNAKEDARGGEHTVEFRNGRAYKQTHPETFGAKYDPVDPGNLKWGTPLEYLTRWRLFNELFPSAGVKFEGVVMHPNGALSLKISQPKLEGARPTTQQVADTLTQAGWSNIGPNTWQKNGVTMTDAKTSNFKVIEGLVVPIDTILSGEIKSDASFSIAPSQLQAKAPKGITATKTDALPTWLMPKQSDSLPKNLDNPKVRQECYKRLDGALDWLRQNPAQIATPAGWVKYLRKAGVWGEIPMPPSGLAEVYTNPLGYIEKLNGGYHGELSLPDTQTSAKQGMDGTVEMRKLIGEGKAPAPFVVALHHLWGILSRMLSPIDQEGMWLRLIAHRPVLDAIQSSVDGNFTLNLAEWEQLIQDARERTKDGAGPVGNAATANANSFYLMLERLNGRWGDMADVYASKNSREMGRKFWDIGAGKLGIKNKVQRFIGLTFGIPGVIMDRWKFVEFWLPTAMQGMGQTNSSDYFKYSANTPSDDLGIYGVYGGVDSGSER